MIRTKGEAGTGNIIEAVRHMRTITADIAQLRQLSTGQLNKLAKSMRVPVELVQQVKRLGRLPVVNFAAGGIATPADAALAMQLGVDGVFVGSGVFKSTNPAKRAKAIVAATTHFTDPKILAKVSANLGEPMRGLEINAALTKLADRGY
jgi:pyridoxal 5'-phosphate synthase pdxS subunit